MNRKFSNKDDFIIPGDLEGKFTGRLKMALQEKEIAGLEYNLGRSFSGYRNKRAAIFVVATLLLLLVTAVPVTLYYYKPEAKKYFYTFYTPYSSGYITGIYRDEETGKNPAVQFYAAGKYNKALPLLQDYLKVKPDDKQASLLLAICLMEGNRFAEAREILGRIIESGNFYFREDAIWYTALSYIHDADYLSARQLLMQLAGSEVYRSKAETLLRQINQN